MRKEVVILGAGPAGCAAGITLAGAGLEVLLIEVSEFPRDRPGESLHPGVEPIFEQLGVADVVNRAGFLRHAGHHIRWDLDKPERFEAFGKDERGEWLGYQVWRADLDEILLERARSLGVEVWQPCRALQAIESGGQVVGLETDRGTIRSRFLLDATGRNQWLARKLGVSWQCHSPKLTARYGYADDDPGSDRINRFSIPLMQRDSEGWTWIARIRRGRCAWVRLRFDGVDPGPDWFPTELSGARPKEPAQGADVTWRIAEKVAGPGWFLLGDAAAVLDPAASHGVLRALMSGIQAASLIDHIHKERIPDSGAVESYSAWLREWFGTDADRLEELYRISGFGASSEGTGKD